jgi:hypothetical protein
MTALIRPCPQSYYPADGDNYNLNCMRLSSPGPRMKTYYHHILTWSPPFFRTKFITIFSMYKGRLEFKNAAAISGKTIYFVLLFYTCKCIFKYISQAWVYYSLTLCWISAVCNNSPTLLNSCRFLANFLLSLAQLSDRSNSCTKRTKNIYSSFCSSRSFVFVSKTDFLRESGCTRNDSTKLFRLFLLVLYIHQSLKAPVSDVNDLKGQGLDIRMG